MIYLIFSILASGLIFVIFKLSEKFSIKAFPVLVYNYIVAAIIGFIFTEEHNPFNGLSGFGIGVSVFLGIIFILVFMLIAYSSQKAGMSKTAVASKMSVIVPIMLAIFHYDEEVTWLKVLGILLAILGLVLTSYKTERNLESNRTFILPIFIFLGAGLVDSTIEFAQREVINAVNMPSFSILLFANAAAVGILLLIFVSKYRKQLFHWKSILAGMTLGLVNYGSFYFLVSALKDKPFDDSIIFGLNNIGVMLFSLVVGMLLFREHLTTTNKWGVATSISAIAILMISR